MTKSRIRVSRILVWLRRIIKNDQMILSILSVFVGATAGVGVIAIRESIDFIQGLFFGGTSENLIAIIYSLPWWQTLFTPTIGGLMVGLFIFYFIPGRKPQSVAKVIEAPIFHVNGNDPLAVAMVAELALSYRQKFNEDVVIDINCYL